MNAINMARRPRRPATASCRTVEPLERRLCLAALTVGGTFEIESIESPPSWTVGPDLAGTLGHANAWTCTLNDAVYDSEIAPGQASTFVWADSFVFEFTGPDAAVLNDVAASQFAQNFVPFLTVSRDLATGQSSWHFAMAPEDPIAEPYPYPGVFFDVTGTGDWPSDATGCPVVQSMAFPAGSRTAIADERASLLGYIYHGTLTSYEDPVSMTLSAPLPRKPPTLSVAGVVVTEGNTGTTGAAFTVSLSHPATVPVTASYATVDSTAVAGRDYDGAAGTVVFQPGETSRVVVVPVRGDALDEDDESFVLELTGATNADLGEDLAGACTIVDDDAPPAVFLNDLAKAEGGNGATTAFTFTVTLSAPSEKTVTARFGTGDGTARMSDGDYLGTSGSLTFAPGETSKTITVLVKGDKKKEANETFFVNLFGITNAIVGDEQGRGTILNDD